MNQTRLGSMIEVWVNIIIGYFINLGVQLVVYPWFGATFSFKQNIYIGLIFTVVAVIRGYTIRRWFNDRLHKASMRIAANYTK
jgi:hypothetical protein